MIPPYCLSLMFGNLNVVCCKSSLCGLNRESWIIYALVLQYFYKQNLNHACHVYFTVLKGLSILQPFEEAIVPISETFDSHISYFNL